MKRCFTILFVCSLVLALKAQDALYTYADTIPKDSVLLYEDTLNTQDLVGTLSEDQLLLYFIQKQGRELAAKEDSLFYERLRTDTTTAFPFHIGFRDSIRIAQHVDRMQGASSLLMPLLYVPIRRDSLNQTDDNLPASIRLQHNVRQYVSAHNPELYAGVYKPEMVAEINSSEIPVTATPLLPVKALIPDAEEDRLDRIRAIRQRRTHWYKEATTTLHLTQNYVTKNWYAGGNSNFALLGILQGKVIYNNRKNITWENTGEWRFGFSTVSVDTLRKINTTEDIFKLYSKFGIKIVDKLCGSLSADFQTHFFNTWKENTKNLKTGPLTPARFNLSVGLDYKPVRGLSIMFAPLTYRMVAALDTTHVSQTSFSIEKGSKVLNEAGSSIRVEWLWKPVREISLDSKFYFYTNYSRVEIDLEIVADFIINRFLSARILLHPRYDNTVILPDDEHAKMQFKELISVGFSHKFY